MRRLPVDQHTALMMLGVLALAFALRLLFVLWAPGVPTGDGIYYTRYAINLYSGNGFRAPDGSPGILWPPGWPAFIAALYLMFGDIPRAVLVANAVLGAVSATLVLWIGTTVFRRRVGLSAAIVYAVWPGNIYYTATFFTETAFCALLLGLLAALTCAIRAQADRQRLAWFTGAGLVLGAAAMFKAEPLVLLPVIVLLGWCVSDRWHEGLIVSAAVCIALVSVVAPWTYRNYRVFGRFIPTSASGGLNLYVGNRPGANGSADFNAMLQYVERHRGANFAETVIAGDAAGYRDAWEFVRFNPREALWIVGHKLKATYAGDSEAALLVNGVGTTEEPLISEFAFNLLKGAADWYWFGVIALAMIGLITVPRYPVPVGVLLLGPLLAWTVVQAVVFGGQRFHVPQEPLFALLAGVGLDQLWGREAVQYPVRLGAKVLHRATLFAANNWRVVVYVLLILLCVLLAPEQPLKFIYTEF